MGGPSRSSRLQLTYIALGVIETRKLPNHDMVVTPLGAADPTRPYAPTGAVSDDDDEMSAMEMKFSQHECSTLYHEVNTAKKILLSRTSNLSSLTILPCFLDGQVLGGGSRPLFNKLLCRNNTPWGQKSECNFLTGVSRSNIRPWGFLCVLFGDWFTPRAQPCIEFKLKGCLEKSPKRLLINC